MKRLFTILATVFITTVLLAQAPQMLTYQAVVRNTSGVLVVSTQIGMRISILQGTASGTAVYVETQTPTTNANGLVTLNIGGGSVTTGSFDAINWSAGPYFIKTETAVAAPLTTYTITGTSQILSVPYALNALTVTTNANLTGEVTSVGNAATVSNAAVIGKVLTGYASGAGTVTATDNVLQAIQKLNGNNATNANLTGEVTSVGNATTVTNGAVIGKVLTGYTSGAGTVAATDNILQAIQKLNGNNATNANLTGEVTSVGNATTVTNAAVIGKVLTGYTKGAGTVAAADNILQAIQKLDGNDATNANLTGDVTSVGNATTVARINGTSLAGLATGILKNTTITGVPSIAVVGDFPLLNQNTTGSAASFTGSLVGEVTGTQGATVVSNNAVIGKVLTGFTSGAGTVAASDNILQAIQKLNGNDATNANLTGEVTSVGNATTVTNAAVIGKVLTGYTKGAGTVAATDNILQAIQKLDGNAVANANLTGEVTSVGSVTTVTNAAVIGKVLTGYTAGAGTVAATDNILQAVQKLDGNIQAIGGSSHYLGEAFQGGIIFNLYKGSDGLEHGLVVALTESATTLAWQTAGTTTGAIRTWDGAFNTPLIPTGDSPAAAYIASLGAGWYWPSIDELNILFNSRYYVNKAINGTAGTLLGIGDYWTSTEVSDTDATSKYFRDGLNYIGAKTGLGVIRGIKAF